MQSFGVPRKKHYEAGLGECNLTLDKFLTNVTLFKYVFSPYI